MKKLMAIIMFAFFAVSLYAQAPDAVREKFKKEYPEAMSPYWKTLKDNSYKVIYSQKNEQRALVYDKDGNVLRQEVAVKEASVLPAIKDHYKTRTAGEKDYAPSYTVWEITDNSGNKTYFSEHKGKYTYFDKEGKQTTLTGTAVGEEPMMDEKAPIEK